MVSVYLVLVWLASVVGPMNASPSTTDTSVTEGFWVRESWVIRKERRRERNRWQEVEMVGAMLLGEPFGLKSGSLQTGSPQKSS